MEKVDGALFAPLTVFDITRAMAKQNVEASKIRTAFFIWKLATVK